MRTVIQRVLYASVEIDGAQISQISGGLLVLLGIEHGDGEEDVLWLCRKISQLRIFNDDDGKMNHSIIDTKGEILVVSQFTLHAATKKGNRPSFLKAAAPEISLPLYERFCEALEQEINQPVGRGVFGADMKIALVNDGPVTILIDSRARE